MHRFSSRALALIATAGLALAACGSDDPAPAAAPAGSTAPGEDTMAEDSMSESMAEDTMAEDSMSDTMSDSMAEESMAEDSMAEESMSEDTMSDSMAEESMAEESMAEDTMSDVALAAWQTLPITDVNGETFTLGELVGTPIVLEFFATWCPKCREQLGATNDAAATLGDEAAVIALSVETDLSSADVGAYAADNGFDSIRFAVTTPELLAAVVDAFGQSAANPPSTPIVVIDAMGHAGELDTGGESADALVAAVRTGG